MNSKDTVILAGALFTVVLAIAALYGWVHNVIALANADAISGMVVVRAIGVPVAPLGAILGYF